MHATIDREIIFGDLRRLSPEHFNSATSIEQSGDLVMAMEVIDAVIIEVNKRLPSEDNVKLMIRAELAGLAQWMHEAMQVVKFDIVEDPRLREDENLPPSRLLLVQKVIERAVLKESEQMGAAKGDAALRLAQAVRNRVKRVAILLQRASACLWAATRTAGAVQYDAISYARSTTPLETADRVRAYYVLLQEFSQKLQALDVDPCALPVGREAETEAAAICAIRHFVIRRHGELRKWSHPRASVHLDFATTANIESDRGEQLLLSFYSPGSPDPNDPANWAWQREIAEEHLGDLLRTLRHAADALGLAFDHADAAGESLYKTERDEAEQRNQ